MQPHTTMLRPFEEHVQLRHIRDEVTHNKIQRHLNDFNDRITEDDIRNVKIIFAGKQIEDMSKELERIILGK